MNNRIREIRKEQHMSMKMFGEIIGISSAAVSHIENNDNGISRKTIESICSTFHVSEEWLRTGEGPKYCQAAAENQAEAWLIKSLAESGTPFQRRFLASLTRLSPQQWDMLEAFMAGVLLPPGAPEQSKE